MRRPLAIVLGLLLTSCPGDLDQALRQYGYAPVRPASTFWQPGAIVYLKNFEPLEVGYICTAKQVMGENYRPMQSPTLNADLARATRKAVTFSANYLDMIKGDADLHDVKSIKMSLRNARIFEVSDSDVDSRVGKIDPVCMRHVRRRMSNGDPVTMISSALQADVVYTVQYDKSSKLDNSAQLEMLQNLALKLGVEASALGGRTIEAKDLIWGVRDDRTLLSLFDRRYMEQFDRRDSRLLTDERTPSLVDGYDIWHREPEVLEPCPPTPSRRSSGASTSSTTSRAQGHDPDHTGEVLDDGQEVGQTERELSRVLPDAQAPGAAPAPLQAPLTPSAGAAGSLDDQIAAGERLLRKAAAQKALPRTPDEAAYPDPAAVPPEDEGAASYPADEAGAAPDGGQAEDTEWSATAPEDASIEVGAQAEAPLEQAAPYEQPASMDPAATPDAAAAPANAPAPAEGTAPVAGEATNAARSTAPAAPPVGPDDANVPQPRPAMRRPASNKAKPPAAERKAGRRPRPTQERRNSIG